MKTAEKLLYKIKEIEGDMLTPIILYHRLPGEKKFLLESSSKHEVSGRYSFIGSNPYMEFKAEGIKVESTNMVTGEKEIIEEHPIKALQQLFPKREAGQLPFPFFGGAVGYIGYDLMFLDEKIGEPLEDQLEMPDIHFMMYDRFLVYDHLQQKVKLVAVDFRGERTEEELERELHNLENAITAERPGASLTDVSLSFKGTVDKKEFCEMVETAKEHIIRGDIFQVVLSQRLQSAFTEDPFSLYRRLRTSNPSPYLFYLDFLDYQVIGASPESLIRVNGHTVMTNPIAGTRPRGKTELEDRQLERELLEDEKEIAEHRMLVDLGRNDLGRVCEIGTVELEKYQKIEKYKHVMHIVSEVIGKLRPEIHALEALAACLPAGTVSGAPKIRAMQIINTLEKQKRGLYSGAVGYISANGDIDFALAIRTMIVKDGTAYVQAGAGIVYDSVPEKEYEETMHKAKALLEVRS